MSTENKDNKEFFDRLSSVFRTEENSKEKNTPQETNAENPLEQSVENTVEQQPAEACDLMPSVEVHDDEGNIDSIINPTPSEDHKKLVVENNIITIVNALNTVMDIFYELGVNDNCIDPRIKDIKQNSDKPTDNTLAKVLKYKGLYYGTVKLYNSFRGNIELKPVQLDLPKDVQIFYLEDLEKRVKEINELENKSIDSYKIITAQVNALVDKIKGTCARNSTLDELTNAFNEVINEPNYSIVGEFDVDDLKKYLLTFSNVLNGIKKHSVHQVFNQYVDQKSEKITSVLDDISYLVDDKISFQITKDYVALISKMGYFVYNTTNPKQEVE